MGIIAKPEPRLVEVTSLPVFYVDGPARVVIEGSNARVTFFEYRTFGSERVKMPVIELVRPLASCGRGVLAALIEKALGHEVGVVAH